MWLRVPRAASRYLIIGEEGLLLGKTLLATFTKGHLHLDEHRIMTMLQVAYNTKIPTTIISGIQNAERCFKRGDKVLAQMHLALTGLHAVDVKKAQRLFVAEWAMSRGVTTKQLLQIAGLLQKDDSDDEDDSGDEGDTSDSGDEGDFDKDHPRWPAGSPGGIGGEFAPKDTQTGDVDDNKDTMILAGPDDQRFGLPNDFWRWYHRQVKDDFDSDISRPEVLPIYQEWLRLGRPGPEQG
jgi:hypothetical protein